MAERAAARVPALTAREWDAVIGSLGDTVAAHEACLHPDSPDRMRQELAAARSALAKAQRHAAALAAADRAEEAGDGR